MNKIKVLYVEDEPFLSKIVRESLESRQFEVCWVDDGALVMSAFAQFRPEICVLDVMLPNRDGFSIGREIRQNDAGIPILYLTAKSQTEDVLQGFEAGGNDYLRKPFSLEELIVRIHNLLKMSRNTQFEMPVPPPVDGVLNLGRYRFAPQKQDLRIENQSRQLSHRETQLLEILARNPNMPVERRDILNQVWGHDSFFNSRNLDVYIARLRDYLKEDGGVQILTLKGVGYRLIIS
jgi:two-component system, OmpR family, response regulator VicR